MVSAVAASPAGLDSRQDPGVGDTNADCDDEFDCCYSSEAACFRQLGWGPGQIYCPLMKYCATSYNIPRSKCRRLSYGFVVIGLQGGPGPAKVDKSMRGALLPTWRSNYLHVMSYGAKFDQFLAPQDMLKDSSERLEEGIESLWREWAPETGVNMNEGNPFNSNFKKDFYGSYYRQLLEVKNKYDPSNSLWVLSGVGSDDWDYNLNTGRLCKK
ncbi:hypothetical protein ACHAQK_012196 [Fusarium lateritium]